MGLFQKLEVCTLYPRKKNVGNICGISMTSLGVYIQFLELAKANLDYSRNYRCNL